MARMLEHQAKRLLQQSSIPVPEGLAAQSPDEAATVAERIAGPVVVKALVPVGKRGQAGAVRFAEDSRGARECALELLGQQIGAYRIDSVLIEERVDVSSELYISIMIDRDARRPRITVSTRGGIDIEQIARDEPEAIVSDTLSMRDGLHEFRARQIWANAGVSGPALPRLGHVSALLWSLARAVDARLIEINPLFVTRESKIVAGDAVIAIDDNAMFRRTSLERFIVPGSDMSWRPMTELEAEARAIQQAEPYRGSARYLELEGGNIGFLCGGGGASLLLFDALQKAGGEPANYAEIGGNPTEDKVAGMTRVVLSKPGVDSLFVAHNITNNTQVDIIARGVVRGIKEAGHNPGRLPVVVREAGLHDENGKQIFEEAGIDYFGEETTLSQAARAMVARLDSGGAA
jgi:succinyl-CoA synthetase beta subunit